MSTEAEGLYKFIQHCIVVDPVKPIPPCCPYKTSTTEDTLMETTLKYLIDQGLIQESDSPSLCKFGASCTKEGLNVSVCIDYCMLS